MLASPCRPEERHSEACLEGEVHVLLHSITGVSQEVLQAVVDARMHLLQVVETQRRPQQLLIQCPSQRQAQDVTVVDCQPNDDPCRLHKM